MHKFLTLRTIAKFEPLMRRLGVSEVARSRDGFLTAYREAGRQGNLSPYWLKRRDGFIARHMAQAIGNDEALFKADGLPTRRHLALVAWAYSPDVEGLRATARAIYSARRKNTA
jgi:hypothetical protein